MDRKLVPCSRVNAVPVGLYSRSLCPGGVLLEFAVVDCEVRPEVTAVTQGRNTAAETEKEKRRNRVILMSES